MAMPSPMKASRALVMPQYRLMKVLEKRLEMLKSAKDFRGWEVVGLNYMENELDSITARTASGEERYFKAEYFVGADGGQSLTRKASGITFDGKTLPGRLVATDVRYDFKSHGFSDMQFMVDPEHFGFICRIDDAGLWRVAFGVCDTATKDDVHKKFQRNTR